MSKRKNLDDLDIKTEKKPVDGGTSKDLAESDSDLSTINSSTNQLKNQQESTEISEEQMKLKGRHFAYVVYPESAPEDWMEQLKQTGLAFVVSPLHDKDTNADGTVKKAHYHVIVSWGNSTTYRSAVGLSDMLNCPRPQALRSPNGMFRYLTHKDNPEKYQYTELPQTFNGWVRPLDSGDVHNIKAELTLEVCLRDCQEYAELLFEAEDMGAEYLEVAQNNTLYFSKLCDGMRYNPVRVLYRARTKAKTEEHQERLEELLNEYMDKPQPTDVRRKD